MASSPADAKPNARRDHTERLFYLGASLILVLLVLLGFHHFYFQGQAYPGRPLTPPIRSLIITHGVVMALWMVVMVVQCVLIVTQRYAWHRLLGRAGIVLVASALISGWRLGLGAARVNPPELVLWGMDPVHFLLVPLTAIGLFTLFATVGLWQRNHRHIHRPMMFFATLTAVAAAMDRIGPLNGLISATRIGNLWGPYFAPMVLGAALLLVKSLLTRSFDRWFAGGVAVTAVVGLFVMRFGPTSTWAEIAGFLLR